MLKVATLELGDPVVPVVEVVADDAPVQDGVRAR
jgi:hypothetical protein